MNKKTKTPVTLLTLKAVRHDSGLPVLKIFNWKSKEIIKGIDNNKRYLLVSIMRDIIKINTMDKQ
tara:strand:+ start:821 stop:1015 length:195 start_codon:yes stop_codon:yes gene_type:complete